MGDEADSWSQIELDRCLDFALELECDQLIAKYLSDMEAESKDLSKKRRLSGCHAPSRKKQKKGNEYLFFEKM